MRLINNSADYYTMNCDTIYDSLVSMMLDDSATVDETEKTDLSDSIMYSFIEYDDAESGIRYVVIQKDYNLYKFHFNVRYHPLTDEWY